MKKNSLEIRKDMEENQLEMKRYAVERTEKMDQIYWRKEEKFEENILQFRHVKKKMIKISEETISIKIGQIQEKIHRGLEVIIEEFKDHMEIEQL